MKDTIINFYKEISGKDYLAFLVMFGIISKFLYGKIATNEVGFELIFYTFLNITNIIFFLFITYQRWNVLKFGKKQFVFCVVISILSVLYPKPIDYDVQEFINSGASYFKMLNIVLSPLYNIIIIIYILFLVFKNAKISS